MSKQPKPRRSSKQPSKIAVLAELLRVAEEAGTMNVSRDYFRANSTIGDGWNRHWCSFKDFLAAGMADNDLYYEALVEFVDSLATSESSRKI